MASAQRAAGFDMDIRYHNRSERIGIPYGYEASLIDLASWADFLIIATVGGDSTRGLINAEVLKALGPNGIVVNISRGSVIDETALVKTLTSGELGGAGLDVYEAEQIGRAACRERVCRDVSNSGVAVCLKKKNRNKN